MKTSNYLPGVISIAFLAISRLNLASVEAREVIDFKIEKKVDFEDGFLRRQKRGDLRRPFQFSLVEEDGDACDSLPSDEAPPTAQQIFGLSNDIGEDLVSTGIDVTLPDGSTLSRLEHRVNGLPVWNSGATVAKPPPIRGLCAGPAKIRSTSGPLELNRNRREPFFLASTSPNLDSFNTCKEHWGLTDEDEIYENKTKTYVYLDGNVQTIVVEVDIRGLYYYDNMPFRVFCLVNSEQNEVIKSWDGLQSYFSDGGNRKTARYRYGETVGKPQLPAKSRDSRKCMMENPSRTVKIYDMKSGSSRIVPGFTSIAAYNCATGPEDATNGAYGPMADCFFNANKTAEFLLDPEWGFSEDMRKYTPSGELRVGTHYKQRYDNAFWDGSAFYVGDGRNTFLPLCTCEDVVAHEIGHSVTQMTSDLVYSGEPGCLNEAFSDIMAESFEYYISGVADYKIGVNCMKTRPYLRDMSIRMSYKKFHADSDPHHCSAIFNYAFYKLVNSPGWSVKQAWKVFLNANVALWRKSTTMKQAACDVAVSAVRLKVTGEIRYLTDAFKSVDIDISKCIPDVPRPVPTTPQPGSVSSTTTTTRPITTTRSTTKTQPWWATTTRPTTRQTTQRSFTLPPWLEFLPDWLIPDSWTPTTQPYTRPTYAPPQTFRPGTQPPAPTTQSPSSSDVIYILHNCEDVIDLKALTGESIFFKILVEDGSTKMNVFIDAFSGDADLYIKAGELPTTTSYDHRPYWKGSIEWVRSTVTYQGWYYIMINAARGFRDLTLSACFI